MRSDLVTIASYPTSAEAHIARGSLEAAGIRAFVADESTTNWLYGPAVYVKVRVRESDAREAARILAANRKHRRRLHCPHCHSEAVGRTGFLFFRRGWRCDRCGADWTDCPGESTPRRSASTHTASRPNIATGDFSGGSIPLLGHGG